MREVLARTVDSDRLHGYQPGFGPTLISGFARIWRKQVGGERTSGGHGEWQGCTSTN